MENTTLFALKPVIEDALAPLHMPLKPIGTEEIEDCVCYIIYTEEDNGAVRQDRLELRIISFDLDTIYKTENALKNALISIGDNKKISKFESIAVDGGGLFKDYETNVIEMMLYFTIICKSEVNK